LLGLGVAVGLGLEVEFGAREGSGGDGDGAGFFEELGGGDGAVGEGSSEEVEGLIEFGFLEGVCGGWDGGHCGGVEGGGVPLEEGSR